MAHRIKEDEKNERIIRELLRIPANRRCINCNTVGPQYVCTNFWTFICINCSGIHREFTHRVKSVSFAKFTSQEISALQEGGNKRAKEIYFKEWDSQHQLVPDSSNVDRLRDFIKQVYVDRRYTGEKDSGRSPSVKGDSGSGSLPYFSAYKQIHSEQPRSSSYGYGYKTSPGHFDIIDERRRDENSEDGRQELNFADLRSPNEYLKPEGRSPHSQKDASPSFRKVPPVAGIMGGSLPPTQPPKSSGLHVPDSSTQSQSTASSSIRGPSFLKSADSKILSTGSLIDFDTNPGPSLTGTLQQSIPQEIPSLPFNDGGWASFDATPSKKVAEISPGISTLEATLSHLSAPQSASFVNNPDIIAGFASFPNNGNAALQQTIQQHQSLSPLASIQSFDPSFSSPVVVATNNQLASNSQGLMNALAGQSFQQVHETSSRLPSPPTSSETTPSRRNELPQDLFSALYQPVPTPFPGYQTGPHFYYSGYGMQYPTAVVMPTYPYSSEPTKSFDFVDGPKLTQASTFPSMASLQGGLPNINNHSALLRTTSAPNPQWTPQLQTSTSVFPPSGYMVQLGANYIPRPLPDNMLPVTHQGLGGYNMQGAAVHFSGINQHSTARNYKPGTSNSFPAGGNPFS